MLQSMTAGLTTVKVSKHVRERIAKAARSQRVPANEFLDRLVTEWERKQRMAAVQHAMGAMSEEVREGYQDEIQLWESSEEDGSAAGG